MATNNKHPWRRDYVLPSPCSGLPNPLFLGNEMANDTRRLLAHRFTPVTHHVNTILRRWMERHPELGTLTAKVSSRVFKYEKRHNPGHGAPLRLTLEIRSADKVVFLLEAAEFDQVSTRDRFAADLAKLAASEPPESLAA